MYKWQLFWDGFNNSLRSWGLAIAVITAAVLIIKIMTYERKLVSKKVGFALLFLRLAVLSVLAFTLLKPTFRWVFDRNESGRIVVAIDVSESMTLKDIQANPGEKLRWARAMGMIGNEKTNDRINRWIKAYEAGKEPSWLDPGEAGNDDLAASRKENIEGVLRQVDESARKEIALRMLTEGTSPLIKKLSEVAKVDVVVFAGKAEAIDPKSLDKTASSPPATVRSSLSDLRAALTTSTGDDESLLGIVLVTDGRDNVGSELVQAAKHQKQIGAPIYPVLMGTIIQPTDIAITDVKYPKSAFKDDKIKLRAKINTPGFKGQKLVVVLEGGGQDPVRKTIVPDGPEAKVEFDLDTKKKGKFRYTLKVEPHEKELSKENNTHAGIDVAVVDDTARVLLVEGEARWEFRFIDNAYQRDQRVKCKQVVFRQPFIGQLDRSFFPKKLDIPNDPNNLQQSSFAEPDLVILGDVSPNELTDKAWQALGKFVGEAGGTLVMIAGKEHFPRGHKSPILDEMLPVTNLKPLETTGPQAEAAPTERGFRLQLTPEGKREPMFQLENDPQENEDAWASLPGHMWGLVGEAKKGSTVLAHAVIANKKQTLKEQRESAVVVHRNYGFGQVLWIGVDSTWRWRHRIGDKYHHRFWGQIGRWAASSKSSAGNENVRFGPDRTSVVEGEEVQVRARWSKRTFVRFPNIKGKAVVYRADDVARKNPVETVPLKPDNSRPLFHGGRILSLEPGEYKIRLKVDPPHGDKLNNGKPIEADLIVKNKRSVEMRILNANKPLLAQMASLSNGRLFLPDEAHQIPALIRDPNADKEYDDEFPLWSHWTLLTLFFVVLSVEWVVRKLNGLP